MDVSHAALVGACRRSRPQPHRRLPVVSFHHFDFRERDATGQADPQRLQKGLLGGKPGRERLDPVSPLGTVRQLGSSVDALLESTSVRGERPGHACRVHNVEPHPENHCSLPGARRGGTHRRIKVTDRPMERPTPPSSRRYGGACGVGATECCRDPTPVAGATPAPGAPHHWARRPVGHGRCTSQRRDRPPLYDRPRGVLPGLRV